MTDLPPDPLRDRARGTAAPVLAATRAVLDALPPLAPDATPRSFEALKAQAADEAAQ